MEKKDKLSLNDLLIVKYTEIDITEDLVWLLKFDIKDFADVDVALANFNMLKFKDLKKQKNIVKNIKPAKDISKVEINEKEIVFDYTNLINKDFIDEIKNEDAIKGYIKFIIDGNYSDIIDSGFDLVHFEKLKDVCSFWIHKLAVDYENNINKLIELDDKTGTSYNSAMMDLQIAYEHLKVCYFPENINKAFSQWSWREKVLSRSYFYKKYLIDKAVDDNIKAKYDKGKDAKLRKTTY